jgi:hypothetical protein
MTVRRSESAVYYTPGAPLRWAAEFCGHFSRGGEGHTNEGPGCSRSASTHGALSVDRRRSISRDVWSSGRGEPNGGWRRSTVTGIGVA